MPAFRTCQSSKSIHGRTRGSIYPGIEMLLGLERPWLGEPRVVAVLNTRHVEQAAADLLGQQTLTFFLDSSCNDTKVSGELNKDTLRAPWPFLPQALHPAFETTRTRLSRAHSRGARAAIVPCHLRCPKRSRRASASCGTSTRFLNRFHNDCAAAPTRVLSSSVVTSTYCRRTCPWPTLSLRSTTPETNT
jgi:hypothetical protein